MKKVRLKKKVKYALILIFICLVLIIATVITYRINIGKVSNNDELVEFEVKEGESLSSLSKALKEKNLIKSEFFYKLYLKLNNSSDLQVGIYSLSENMKVEEIVNILEGGTVSSKNVVTITFKEGINMRQFISLITEKTDITEEEILSTLKDNSYLDELINNYWFLSDEIKNPEIYYSLEGYLFPDTYEFQRKSTIKEIFTIMLDHTSNKLEGYKNDLENSGYTIHQIMTLASIIELEAANSDDRSGVAGVFYNRLTSGWSLGSDVTTYYAIKVDMSERDLYQEELNQYNAYNTRCIEMAGKLPVGPICLPSIESIEAALYPTSHDYYYFVADKNKKTYFSKTSAEHINIVNQLQRENLWYEY